MALILIE